MTKMADNHQCEARGVAPWDANPYELVSWWDMEKFSAEAFYKIARFIEMASIGGEEAKRIMMELGRGAGVSIRPHCEALGLAMSVTQTHRVKQAIDHMDEVTAETPQDQEAIKRVNLEYQTAMKSLQERIQDEMAKNLFLFVPPEDAPFYNNADAYAPVAAVAKWAHLSEDFSEGAKCFALGRYTSTVFHLMRVMEFGVQKLGDRLGVQFIDQKNWQPILDEVNKAIKTLDQKDAATKKLSALASHLYHVKLAWRNEVMHPKATYTREEANRVLESVIVFTEELAAVA
jgi:hypothetical protein